MNKLSSLFVKVGKVNGLTRQSGIVLYVISYFSQWISVFIFD